MGELESRAASCVPSVADSIAPVAMISKHELTSETTCMYTRAEAVESIGALQRQVKALMQHLAKCDGTCAQAVWGLNTALRGQLPPPEP